MSIPKTAYVLLWFPEPTETFIFREVNGLLERGQSLQVYSLYGKLTQRLTPEMENFSPRVERQGLKYAPQILPDMLYWLRRKPSIVWSVLRNLPILPYGRFAKNSGGAGLKKYFKQIEKSGENLWAGLAAFGLARRFVRDGIEHVHAPWASGPATAAWAAARLAGIPFSFTARAWDIYPPDNALPEKVREAAFVRVNAGSNADYIRRMGGLREDQADKVQLIYNGVPLQSAKEASVKMKPPYTLLALGRFVPKKGYDYLIRAVAILGEQGMDVRCILAGDGPLAAHLKGLVKDLGLENKVEFPGFVKFQQAQALFDQADIFVMPSVIAPSGDRDGIPNVIMEAFAHRVPVVATNVSGIGEVVLHGETGLLVEQRDAEGLAQAIRKMSADREQALRLAENGRERVFKQFDPEVSCRRIMELIARTTPDKNA